ncbi:hypothetical protein D3C72_2073270 [compost metagenome]
MVNRRITGALHPHIRTMSQPDQQSFTRADTTYQRLQLLQQLGASEVPCLLQ